MGHCVPKTKMRFRQHVTETMATPDPPHPLDLHVDFSAAHCHLSFESSGLLRISVVLSFLWPGQSDPVFTKPYLGSLGQSLLLWASQARTLGSLVRRPSHEEPKRGTLLPFPGLQFGVGPSD